MTSSSSTFAPATPPQTKFNQLNFVIMKKQIVEDRKSVMFTEQKLFVLGDERYRIEKPLIEQGYLKLREGTTPTQSYSEVNDKKTRCNLFLKYAHLLFEKRDIIISDSRLYNVELPITTLFCAPRLGDYMIWWKNYKCSQVIDPNGSPQFIYSIWGSMISGPKGGVYVDCNGESFSADICHLSYALSSLGEVCKSRKFVCESRDVLTLEQTIELLFGEE